MALYEYACNKCGHNFERIMKRGARAPRCPECGSGTKRLLSAPAIHFKGTGWYVTDYARKGKDGGKESAEKEKADSSTKTADKTADKTKNKKKTSGDKSTGKK